MNTHLTEGNALLIAEGGAARLDNLEAKNVIFKNVELHYAGGPLILTNVYFVNCRFVMDPASNSIELAQTILSTEAAASYTASSS